MPKVKVKTLVIFSPGFANNESDTNCIPFLQQTCLSIKRTHPDLNLVVFAFQYPFRIDDYLWHGIRVISFGGSNGRGIAKLVVWLRVLLKFRKLNREENIIGVFSVWLTECAFVGKIIEILFAIKQYVWIVGQDARPGNRYARLASVKEEQLVAFSGSVRDEMKKNYGLYPAHLIVNGIEPSQFETLNMGKRPIEILGAGSLIPLKNFGLFIKVVELVSKRINLKCAEIIGDGPDYEVLRYLAEESRLKEIITFSGSLQHKEVLGMMNKSKVFLHTSTYEGNPGVIHEALYSGCQVISTCKTEPEAKENFYEFKNAENAADRIVSLLQQSGINNKRVTLNTFDNTATQIVQLFE